MTNQPPPQNRRPPMPTLNHAADQAHHARPMASTQPTQPTDRVNPDWNLPTQPVRAQRPQATPTTRPVNPKLSAGSTAIPGARQAAKSGNRHTVRIALATGTTIAVMLGTQALAVFGRTADANPVVVGASADDPQGQNADSTQVAAAATEIPTDVPSDTPIPTNTPQPSATNTSTVTKTATTVPSKTAISTNTPHPTVIKYTVLSSDTLGSIALKFNTSTAILLSMNSSTIKNANVLTVGQIILVPGPLSTDPITPSATATITQTPSVTPTATITYTPSSTSTAKPTSTPKPTSTVKPTTVYVAPVQPAPSTKSSRH